MAPQFFGGGRSLSEWTLSSHITIKKRQTTLFFSPSPPEPNVFDYDKIIRPSLVLMLKITSLAMLIYLQH